jgi:hypothetical protein
MMNSLWLVVVLVGMPALAWGLHSLQARLEHWDYERHAGD